MADWRMAVGLGLIVGLLLSVIDYSLNYSVRADGASREKAAVTILSVN